MSTIVKSTSVTNLDTVPAIVNNAGIGAPDRLKVLSDVAAIAISDGVAGFPQIAKVVRVASTVCVKNVLASGAALTKAAFDIGVYYSTSTVDGTLPANQGNAIHQSFFFHSFSFAGINTNVDATNGTGAANTVDKRQKALWDALGLSSDPGGYFDIAITQLGSVTAAGNVALQVQFAQS